MANEINVKENIKFFQNKPPIKFVYTSNIDRPENHHLHINQFYEIYIFVEGYADYIVGDSYFTLKKGDVILINQYETHKVVLKETGFYERFYLLVPIDSFDGFAYNPFDNITPKLISLSDKKRSEVLNILFEMKKILGHDNNEQKSFNAYGLFLQFLSLISNEANFIKTDPLAVRPNKLPKFISDILIYIDANLTKIDSVGALAKHFCISQPYLSTTFKKYIGTSIKIYIQTKKIAYAKELLDKNYTVTEACYESGFNDCSYFAKIFKSHTGITPLNYQKSHNPDK